MNTEQIYKVLKADKDMDKLNFRGVFPIDKIPNEEFTFPSCAVINTKPHTDRGEHWVCFIKNRDRTGIYFDSYGYPPYNLPEVGDVLANCIDWTYNAKSLQTPFSTVCGEYCIFFLTHMAKGFTLDHIINLLDDNGDTFANDAFVYSYTIHKYRNVINTSSLNVIDIPLIIQSVANAQY